MKYTATQLRIMDIAFIMLIAHARIQNYIIK